MIEPQSDGPMNDQPKVQRIIQMQFPITWLITAALAVMGALLGLYVKFNDYGKDIQNLTATVAQLNAKTDTRDDRITAVVQEMIQVKASQANLIDRLQRTEGDLKESRDAVKELTRNQRWMPK